MDQDARESLVTRIALKLSVAALLAASVWAGEPVRIDASSDRAAEESWARMLESADPATRERLQFAMVKINLMGVKSARETVGRPEFDALGIVRIKGQVAGMSAQELIALGETNRDLRIEVQR